MLRSGKSYNDDNYMSLELEQHRKELITKATRYSLKQNKGNVPPIAVKDANETGAFYFSHGKCNDTVIPNTVVAGFNK